MKQSSKRNLTMVMDLYELTMANGYFNDGDKTARVAFDVFYRKNPDRGGFAIFAGLEQIVEYIEDLHFSDEDVEYLRSLNTFTEDFLQYLRDFKFSGDVYAFPPGTYTPTLCMGVIFCPRIVPSSLASNQLLRFCFS